MMQEESNAENSFEFIEKNKIEQQNYDSSKAERANFPPPPMSSGGYVPKSIHAGNLLSSVPPPSALPSFIAPITQPIPTAPVTSPLPQPSIMPPAVTTTTFVPSESPAAKPSSEHFYPTTFSAAIPPNKGAAIGTPSPGATTSIPLSLPEHEDQGQGGLFGWVKGAVSGSGILSKMAEKAKNSVDSMITTLDPQMREYIYSGGDLEVLVASDNEGKVSAVREAFQKVFGKATVIGVPAQASSIAAQPVGFQAGIASAKERIAFVHTDPHNLNYPTVAVENFLLQVEEEMWYDIGVLILNDPTRQVFLQTFTQTVPVPSAVVTSAQSETPADYTFKSTGFAVPVGGLIANSLQVSRSEWQETLTGVSRRTMILSAAKVLAGLYKNSVQHNS